MSTETAVQTAEEGFFGKTLALASKDLRVEVRGRDTLLPMLTFCIAVILLLAFALPPGGTARTVSTPLGEVPLANVLAGFLWVTVLFAGLIAFARTFEIERADDALSTLLLIPVDRSALFLAKGIANLLYLLLTQLILIPSFALFFRVDLRQGWTSLILVVILVDIGFVAVGTLFAALAAQTSSRELMLPILALPALVPVFIAAVELTSDLFGGAGASQVLDRGWFGILVAFDLLFGIVGALVFEFVLEP